ncbi:MAG: response regulator transcription factor [Thermodesulfobacteriota bacterium]
MAGQTILIVDDDAHIRDVVRFALGKAGFQTIEAENGQAALDLAGRAKPDLLILDILMPELDGTEVCRRLRTFSKLPVIFLSSQDDEIDRVVGLELGGDDYIAKPFSPRELVARVKAVLRRSGAGGGKEENGNELVWNGIRLDRQRFQVFFQDQQIDLTVTEFGLIATLMASPERVYSRDQLMDQGYKGGSLVTDRTIDSHIRKIRQKFRDVGCDPIETVRGVGYRMGFCQ